MPYPSGLTTLLRYDGAQPAFADLAQTTPAVAPYGRVRSLRQPVPLSGSWTAPSDSERPLRYAANTIACEPLGADWPTHFGRYLNAPAYTAFAGNSVTLAMSFRAFKMYDGPQAALFSYGASWGARITGNGLTICHSGGSAWDTGIRFGKDLNQATRVGNSGEGNLIRFVTRFRSTGIDIVADESGQAYANALVAAISNYSPPLLTLGFMGPGLGNALFGQVAVIDGYVTDGNRDDLMTWLGEAGVAEMFQPEQRLVSIISDSIGVPIFANQQMGWAYRMLDNLRATFPEVQLLNTSIGGTGVSALSGPGSCQYTTTLSRLDATRPAQVSILTHGTNDIVGDPTDAGVDSRIAMQFALADALRAAGSRVLIANLLDRRGLLGGRSQAEIDHARARWNAALAAHWAEHADGLIDLAGIASMSNASNTTYYSDGVHPTDVGHGELAPAYTAPTLALLSGTPAMRVAGIGGRALSSGGRILGLR